MVMPMSAHTGRRELTIEVEGIKPIIVEGGHISRQSDGAVFVRCGGTVIHASVISSPNPSPNVDFIPLTVDYRERFSAAGKIPGGFFKKEMGPNDTEILVSRLVDRSLRPLFPDRFFYETQVIITLFSYDEEVPPDTLACVAASSAIAMSSIPFHGPVAAVRICKVDGQWVANPSKSVAESSSINIIVAGTANSIVMVEGEARECSEEEFVEALEVAHTKYIKKLCQAIEEFGKMFPDSTPKREISPPILPEHIKNELEEAIFTGTYQICSMHIKAKKERREKLNKCVEEAIAAIKEKYAPEWMGEFDREAKIISKEAQREAMRRYVFETGYRIDGRLCEDIRPLDAVVAPLSGPHGSALFARGETQVLASVVLGSQAEDVQIIDEVTESGKKKYLLHYNFPPYSVGEIRPLRAPTRREIGHSYLALKGIKAVMPPEDDYPFVVRIIADVLESNGSSSMATVCAASMALMDGGIPVKGHVAGIAMGLLWDEKTGRYLVLTDILGDEDHLGDMDFKVCGTRNGITACQMDIKLKELKFEILLEAIRRARKAHFEIIDFMEKHISAPRSQPKDHAPKMDTVKIPKDMIGMVIGTGGKVVRTIAEATGTSIHVVPKETHGVVEIVGISYEGIKKAKEMVEGLIKQPRVGEVYVGQVKTITPYGAFVEIAPGKVGLLHISEIDYRYIRSPQDVLKEGDYLEVKVIDVDPDTGRFRLSRKALLPEKNTVKNG